MISVNLRERCHNFCSYVKRVLNSGKQVHHYLLSFWDKFVYELVQMSKGICWHLLLKSEFCFISVTLLFRSNTLHLQFWIGKTLLNHLFFWFFAFYLHSSVPFCQSYCFGSSSFYSHSVRGPFMFKCLLINYIIYKANLQVLS